VQYVTFLHTSLGKSLWVSRRNYECYKAWKHFAAIVGSELWSQQIQTHPGGSNKTL